VKRLLLLASLTAGCNGLDLRDVATTYTLAQADGRGLPILLSATVNCDRLLVGGGLVLTEAGAFTLTFHLADDCSRAGGGTIALSRSYTGTFTLTDGDVILLSDAASGGWQFDGGATALSVSLRITDTAVSPSGALETVFVR
jgi:hypothetical protein